jgi:glycerol kinase
LLPDVCDSSGVLAYTDPEEFFGSRAPICGIAGDQQAALFGQLCLNPGEVKSTCGTGSFLLMNTGSVPVRSKNGLLTTLACPLDGNPAYALEGSIFVAGSAVQWIRDGLRIVDSSGETDSMASSLKGNDGVYFVPAFVGLGTPYWNQDARGTIIGITRGTTRAHIARATLESIAYQTRDVLDAMVQDSGMGITALKVDGGMAKNDFMMGFMADVTGIEVIRPSYMESTALGAAYLAGLGIGIWKDTKEISANWKPDRSFSPGISRSEAEALHNGWKKAISASLAACS